MSFVPRILIVEDDASLSEQISNSITEFDAKIEMKIVNNRDDAIKILDQEEFFDLLNLDLIIPPTALSADKKIEYGMELLNHCRKAAPGLPILVLTGSGSDTYASDFLKSSSQADIWGAGTQTPTVDYIPKLKLDVFERTIREKISHIKSLGDIELNKQPDNLEISIRDDRLIRIFCKRRNGTRCAIYKISEGLSKARVYRLKIYNNTGGIIHDVVCKMGNHQIIKTEEDNYNKHISRLRPEVTPRHLETIIFGAKDTAAVFYGMAEGYPIDFFEAVNQNNINTELFKNMQAMTDNWYGSHAENTKTIKDIRRLLLSDTDAESLIKKFNIPWASTFEENKVQVKWCCVHGDLHGKNVLVNSNKNTSNIIDYGDLQEAPASLDPVTLELSLFFHPKGIQKTDWPTPEQAQSWFLLDDYLKNCPIAEAITLCREWARQVGAGKREIAACAYSYLLRQLKYADTSKELALSLLEGAKNLYAQT